MANEYTILQSDGVTSFIVYPLESNGPGNTTRRQINAVDQTGGATANFFVLRGDVAYRFVLGFTFTVINSAGNDGTYTVTSNSIYSSGPNTTTIIVDEAIPSAAVPVGDIQYTNAVYNTSLTIPGRGVTNYGEQLAINSVRMLENFAHTVAPANPLTGQLWYNTTTNVLNIFDTTWVGGAGGDPHYTSDSPDGTALAVPPVASGPDSLAMGDGAVAVADFPGPTLAIGDRAKSLEYGAVAIGSQAVAADWLTVAVGESAHAGRLPNTGPAIIGGSQAGGAGVNYFEVSFNFTSTFVPGLTFDIITSTGNDGTYTVVSSSYGTTTLIIVVEVIPSATFDGSVEYPREGLFGAIAIGATAYSYPASGIAIGSNSIAGDVTGSGLAGNASEGAISVGGGAWAKAKWATAIGFSAGGGETAEAGISLGYQANAREKNTIAIGRGAGTGDFTPSGSDNAIAIGTGADASTALDPIAIGANASATGLYSVSLGSGANSTAQISIAIGRGAEARAIGTIAIGGNVTADTEAKEQQCIAIGTQAKAGQTAGATTEEGAIAIGNSAQAYELQGIAIGQSAMTGRNDLASEDPYGIAIGANSGAFEQNCIALGYLAQAGQTDGTLNHNAIAIGNTAIASGLNTIAIGTNNDATGTDSIAIGQLSIADATDSTAVGRNAGARGIGSICVGSNGGSVATANETNNIAIGVNASSGRTPGGTDETHAVAIGFGAIAYKASSVAIGQGSRAGQNIAGPMDFNVALGANARAYEHRTIAIGVNAEAGLAAGSAASNSIAIGDGASSTVSGTIAIGVGAATSNVGEIVHRVGNLGVIGIHTKRIVISQVFTANSLVAFTDSPVIPDDTAWKFVVNVVARQDTSGDVASYKFDGLLKRIAGTVTLVGTNTKQAEEEDATWDCEVVADDTGKKLSIQFQTDAVTDVNVLADILITEV